MRIAAIDIGSNAVRLLISDVVLYKDGSPDFIKCNLVRIPLRLGFEVFENGHIPEPKVDAIVETMKAFYSMMKVYEVKAYRACATSAMRDADNSADVVERVFKQTGIRIEVISGNDEAGLLFGSHVASAPDIRSNCLYIDVGGGSTELSLFNQNQLREKKSFNIGTIRLLKSAVSDDQWDEMQVFIKNRVQDYHPVAFGFGGNINKIFSMSKKKTGKPLTNELLRSYLKEFSSMNVAERMHKYGFRSDRADVIVPALQIYTSVLRWSGITEIFVPQVGLVDALIRLLYQELSFTSMKAKPNA